MELGVELDGQSVDQIWTKAFDRLLAFHDRDGDGALNRQEANHLPAPFAVRQLLWCQFTTFSGSAPNWQELDTTGDERVERAELADFYRRAGLGNVLVGYGKPLMTDELASAILARVDADHDRRTTQREWESAYQSLRALDRNDDELIGADELVARTVYPGAAGASLLLPPQPSDRSSHSVESCPLIVLPSRKGDDHWAVALLQRRDRNSDGTLSPAEAGFGSSVFEQIDADHDGRLASGEIAAARTVDGKVQWHVRLGDQKDQRPALASAARTAAASGAGGRLVHHDGQIYFELRADQGKLPAKLRKGRQRLQSRFAEADANVDGFIDVGEVANPNLSDVKELVRNSDRDGDGRLAGEEFSAWLDLQTQFAQAHVLLTVLDHGAGLFELLDDIRDGTLSVRELRSAWPRLGDFGGTVDGRFDAALLPRQLIATISRGHPLSSLARLRPNAPVWFAAMDRNGDGDVSSREFLGMPADFRKLDRDRDGAIDSAEAASPPPEWASGPR